MMRPDPRGSLRTYGSARLVVHIEADTILVCSDLRPSDELDIAAATTLPPRTAVDACARRSDPCYTLLCEEVPSAILGVERSGTPGVGSCWLIGTRRFERAMRKGLVRHSADCLDYVTDGYSTVFNFVPIDNGGDLRWLDHLGFERGPIVENYRGLGTTCQRVVRELPVEGGTADIQP